MRNAKGELERLEVQLADMERPLPGATFNLNQYRAQESQKLRDRIDGIRRRSAS